MADWIRMPFGVVSGVGRGMGVLDGVVIDEGKGQFGGEFGRPIVTNGMLLRSCAEVREPIQLSFGMVSGVGQALLYGMEDHVAQAEGCILGLFVPLAQWLQ